MPKIGKLWLTMTNSLRARMALDDLIQSVPGPRCDIVEPFAAGDANLRRFAAPAQ